MEIGSMDFSTKQLHFGIRQYGIRRIGIREMGGHHSFIACDTVCRFSRHIASEQVGDITVNFHGGYNLRTTIFT